MNILSGLGSGLQTLAETGNPFVAAGAGITGALTGNAGGATPANLAGDAGNTAMGLLDAQDEAFQLSQYAEQIRHQEQMQAAVRSLRRNDGRKIGADARSKYAARRANGAAKSRQSDHEEVHRVDHRVMEPALRLAPRTGSTRTASPKGDDATAAQHGAFDDRMAERAELLREANILRDMMLEQLKNDDEALKKYIAMI